MLFRSRGKRIHRETEYVRALRDGTGVTGDRSRVLPRGMQTGSKPIVKEQAGIAVDVPEIDYAMATATAGAEGLMPMYEEAQKRSDWPKWKIAIQEELNNLKETRTWRLVERPAGANVVDCRCVLRIKKNLAGEVERYKARLVAKGFTQIHGIDYYETYAPVARLTSFRLILALAARNGWTVDEFDFDSAYLNTVLGDDEVIYLEQPPGYETKDRRKFVYRLLKGLYGLKQGARNWYLALC